MVNVLPSDIPTNKHFVANVMVDQFFVTCSVCKLKESDWVALLTNIEPEEHKIMCRECFIKSQAKPVRKQHPW